MKVSKYKYSLKSLGGELVFVERLQNLQMRMSENYSKLLLSIREVDSEIKTPGLKGYLDKYKETTTYLEKIINDINDKNKIDKYKNDDLQNIENKLNTYDRNIRHLLALHTGRKTFSKASFKASKEYRHISTTIDESLQLNNNKDSNVFVNNISKQVSFLESAKETGGYFYETVSYYVKKTIIGYVKIMWWLCLAPFKAFLHASGKIIDYGSEIYKKHFKKALGGLGLIAVVLTFANIKPTSLNLNDNAVTEVLSNYYDLILKGNINFIARIFSNIPVNFLQGIKTDNFFNFFTIFFKNNKKLEINNYLNKSNFELVKKVSIAIFGVFAAKNEYTKYKQKKINKSRSRSKKSRSRSKKRVTYETTPKRKRKNSSKRSSSQ